ncbi:MAG TPA: T9SS type A sorting domain-containing protein, partial [Bacteroidia bacterium]|nr:T9SS type A sorting domain-containing protein [Bacteroidia bacterium]
RPPSILLYMPWNNEGDITCTDTGFFYFPVGIESDSATRFNNCVMDLYIGDEFKGDNVSNGGITVTQGSQFLPGAGNDYSILNVTNVSDTVIQIQFGSPVDSSPNGTIVSPTATYDTLLFVKLEMQNCKAPLVTFTDTATTSSLSNYTYPAGTPYSFPDSALQILCHCGHYTDWNAESSADSLYCCVDSFDYRYFDTVGYTTITQNLPYMPTKYYGYVDFRFACDPVITDFNSPINAGVGDTLTITGLGFGYPRGTGRVEFHDADSLSQYTPQMNDIDYISWTNTQIKIRLPGFVDSAFTNKASQSTIGGGDFIVGNGCGGGQYSYLNLNGNRFSVYYNIDQTWIIYNYDTTKFQKNEVMLRQVDTNGGYVLHLNPVDFPVGSIRRKIYAKAVRDWVCYTGVNWTIGRDTVLAYNMAYPHKVKVNYVFFTDSLPPKTVARTDRWAEACRFSAQLKEGDMYFNADTSMHFVYDTTETVDIPPGEEDFYGDCLHELGHLIGLGHDVVRGNLMYWAANDGYIAAPNRITLASATAASAVDGGIYSVTQSIHDSNVCDSTATMIPVHSSCVNETGIQKVQENANFVVYPNPSNGTFTIESSINEYTLVVVNMLGQRILSQRVLNKKEEIALSTVANGMYFIQEQYKNGVTTQKLIITK